MLLWAEVPGREASEPARGMGAMGSRGVPPGGREAEQGGALRARDYARATLYKATSLSHAFSASALL